MEAGGGRGRAARLSEGGGQLLFLSAWQGPVLVTPRQLVSCLAEFREDQVPMSCS